jgi:hypothetical protein
MHIATMETASKLSAILYKAKWSLKLVHSLSQSMYHITTSRLHTTFIAFTIPTEMPVHCLPPIRGGTHCNSYGVSNAQTHYYSCIWPFPLLGEWPKVSSPVPPRTNRFLGKCRSPGEPKAALDFSTLAGMSMYRPPPENPLGGYSSGMESLPLRLLRPSWI